MIEERLQIYGPSTCPLCGDHRETVFVGAKAGPLVCRKHPGHPLYTDPAPDGGQPDQHRVSIGVAS